MELLRPSTRYSIRLYMQIIMAGILMLTAGSILAWVISMDLAYAIRVNEILQTFIFVVLLGVLLLIAIANRYCHRISYEFNLHEIKLKRGLWLQVVHHIPLCNIAVVTVKRDFIDRCLEIGSLEFLLFGSLNNKIHTVCFVGLSDVEAHYLKISKILQHYWGATPQHPVPGSLNKQVVFANSEIDLR
jgi:membrane protein YdbS with pleckstrin-like domain